jgi:hypothetical protein
MIMRKAAFRLSISDGKCEAFWVPIHRASLRKPPSFKKATHADRIFREYHGQTRGGDWVRVAVHVQGAAIQTRIQEAGYLLVV